MTDIERFEILDCSGIKTGTYCSRDEAHRTGVWHGAFHCLILCERNGLEYALFQKRSASKKIAPGKFDVSVGGHYSAGEDAVTAGPREIREELGLDVAYEDLVSVGRRIFVYGFTPGVIEHEFQDVFLLHRQIRPEMVSLQREEVEGLLEMELNEGIRLFSGDLEWTECTLMSIDRTEKRRKVSAGEFVPCLDNYYIKLLLLARRYLNGERKLLFI